MGFYRWFTANYANTTDPSHPDLGPLRLPGSIREATARLTRACGAMRGWRVVAANADLGTAHLTRTTRVLRFVDDIRITCSEEGAGTRVDAESRSRAGLGDFGQNRRNIRELWEAVR